MQYCLIRFQAKLVFIITLKLKGKDIKIFCQTIRPEVEWNSLHHIGSRGCSCTCLATNSGSIDVVTAGEDGRINVLKLDQRHPVRSIGKK